MFVFFLLQLPFIVVNGCWTELFAIYEHLCLNHEKAYNTSQQSSSASVAVPKKAGWRCSRLVLFFGLNVAWNKVSIMLMQEDNKMLSTHSSYRDPSKTWHQLVSCVTMTKITTSYRLIHQFLYSPRMPTWAIGNMQRGNIIVVHLQPANHFCFQVSFELTLRPTRAISKTIRSSS